MLHKTQPLLSLSEQALAGYGLGHPWGVSSKIQLWPTQQCWPGNPCAWRRHWQRWEPGPWTARTVGLRLHKKRHFPASGWALGGNELGGREVRVPAAGGRAGRRFPSALGQGKGLALLPRQICHYSGRDWARGLENTIPFWRGLSLCWDFSALQGNEMKTNSEPRSLPSKINRDVGVVMPLVFLLHPPVMAGRDELTPLLLSCPANPAWQETGASLPASLPATGVRKEDVPRRWVPVLLPRWAWLCQLVLWPTAPCGTELCAPSPMAHVVKPQEKQGKLHTKSCSNPSKAVWGPFLPPLRSICGCCNSCMPRLSFSPLLGHWRSAIWDIRMVLRVLW